MDRTKQLCEDILKLVKEYERETKMEVTKLGLDKSYKQAFSYGPLGQMIYRVEVGVRPKIDE